MCGDSTVEATLTNYGSLDPASLYVGDPACAGTVSGEDVTFSTPLDACGVVVTVSNSSSHQLLAF